jgi:hypothetical protein
VSHINIFEDILSPPIPPHPVSVRAPTTQREH